MTGVRWANFPPARYIPPGIHGQKRMLRFDENGGGDDVTPTVIVTAPSIKVRCEVCGDRFTARRRSARTCSPACRQRLSRGLRASTPPLPAGPFDLILADPPWHFKTYSEKGQGKSPSAHYATMGIESICRLPIGDITASDAGLAMWVYGPRLPDALKVMRAWGFEYKSDLLTWIKIVWPGIPHRAIRPTSA